MTLRDTIAPFLTLCITLCLFTSPLAADEPAGEPGGGPAPAPAPDVSTPPASPSLEERTVEPWFDRDFGIQLRRLWDEPNLTLLRTTLEQARAKGSCRGPDWCFDFLSGLVLARMGDPKAATLLTPLVDKAGPYLPYVRLALARSLLAAKDYDGALKALNQTGIVEGSPLWGERQTILAQVLGEAGRRGELLDFLEKATAAKPVFPGMARLLSLLARPGLTKKDKPRVYALLRSCYQHAPETMDSDAFAALFNRLGGVERTDRQRAEDFLGRAESYFQRFQYKDSLDSFAQAGDNAAAGEELWCRAVLGQGRSHFRLRQYTTCLETLEPALAPCAKAEAATREHLLHLKAYAYFNKDQRAQARTTLSVQLATAPDGAFAAEARNLLVNLAFRDGDQTRAAQLARELVQRHPSYPDGVEALWLAAWTAFRSGEMTQAAGILTDITGITTADPVQTQRAWYWLGRIEHKAGHTDTAAGHYRKALSTLKLSFYGLLAARRLEEMGQASPWQRPAGFPLSYHVPWDELKGVRHPVLDNPDFTTGMALLATGMLSGGPAGAHFLTARDQAGDSLGIWLLAAMLYHSGDTARAVNISRSTFNESSGNDLPDNDSAPFWLMAFPRMFEQQITTAVKEQATEPAFTPELLFALAREESSFNPEIMSYARAIGLTQVIESTARHIATQLKVKNFRFRDLTDPAVSARFGAYYLNGLVRQFKGRLPLAIASYNAGPGRIQDYLRRFGDLPLDEFLESFTLEQPRRYTKRVLRTFATYRALYTDADILLPVSLEPPRNAAESPGK